MVIVLDQYVHKIVKVAMQLTINNFISVVIKYKEWIQPKHSQRIISYYYFIRKVQEFEPSLLNFYTDE